jgi:hypothetical protein
LAISHAVIVHRHDWRHELFVRSYAIRIPQLATLLLLLPADVAEHIRMDAQTDIGHIIKMFAGNEPDDLADRTFGIMAGHASKSVSVNLFIFGQLRHIVQCRAFCVRKKRARAVLELSLNLGDGRGQAAAA